MSEQEQQPQELVDTKAEDISYKIVGLLTENNDSYPTVFNALSQALTTITLSYVLDSGKEINDESVKATLNKFFDLTYQAIMMIVSSGELDSVASETEQGEPTQS